MPDSNEPLQPDPSELNDYREWHEIGLSLFDYAATKLTPDLAIASTKLFWPDFVVYRDCIFRHHVISDKSKAIADDWITQLNGDLTAVEHVMNHVHVGEDLMRYPFEILSYPNVAYFGQILVKMWGAALRDRFPGRPCVVEGWKEDWETTPLPSSRNDKYKWGDHQITPFVFLSLCLQVIHRIAPTIETSCYNAGPAAYSSP